jgi:hypothetical protein
MTTKVTIDPAGHKVSVTITCVGDPTESVELEPGTPPREFWLHGKRILTAHESDATLSGKAPSP